MTRLLSLFGLMRVSEHERAIRFYVEQAKGLYEETTAHEAKFKKAVADLEKQAGEIETLKALVERLRDKKNRALAEADDLRPDALAMRRKRQMDRDRRKGNG